MGDVEQKTIDQLGDELVAAQVITRDQWAVAQEVRRNLGGDLGRILMKRGFVRPKQLLDFVKAHLKLPVVTLSSEPVDAELTKQIPASLARQYQIVPLRREGDVVTIALSDPLDVFSIGELEAKLRLHVKPVLADPQAVEQWLAEHYQHFAVAERATDIAVINVRGDGETAGAEKLKEIASGLDVITRVNHILVAAIKERASDIHIEPQATTLRVRTRVDGLLEERLILPKGMHLPIVSRIKIMAAMDIAERRVPQDGRVRLVMGNVPVDMRISTCPTMYGEKAVIRLFRQGAVMGVTELGFTPDERKLFETLIVRPYGILLVTGPTGAGKTSTLYAALDRINAPDKNIISIEDPIEHEIIGVNQAQVHTRAGMTFASALRSILRQDPDVIMVGEIRDRETADIAVRAAITGHLVFSTLHTNTAIGAFARLTDLGVEPFLTAAGVIGVVAQRLVRRICPACAEPAEVAAELLTRLGIPKGTRLSKGRGCKACRMSGFVGRIGIFEFAVMTPELKKLIMNQVPEEELVAIVRQQGGKDLRMRGVERVLAGETTVEEVLRVTEA